MYKSLPKIGVNLVISKLELVFKKVIRMLANAKKHINDVVLDIDFKPLKLAIKIPIIKKRSIYIKSKFEKYIV